MNYNLRGLLNHALEMKYAIGSFSPRYTPMIRPILKAAQYQRSPCIVQISQKELTRYCITPIEFAEEFERQLKDLGVTVPSILHLDHTKDFSVIESAVRAGFDSVMIDASERSLEENIKITKTVVEFAHAHSVEVEAELGRIGTTDYVESSNDTEFFTDPSEARYFAINTGIDALAVSVGTAHGLYINRIPSIDMARLQQIKSKVAVPLVLHGGSGVPSHLIHATFGLIAKVNIATDLEQALLAALKRKERMTNAECVSLSENEMIIGQAAIEVEVTRKMSEFLHSTMHAD